MGQWTGQEAQGSIVIDLGGGSCARSDRDGRGDNGRKAGWEEDNSRRSDGESKFEDNDENYIDEDDNDYDVGWGSGPAKRHRAATLTTLVEDHALGAIGMEGGILGGRLGGRRTKVEGAMARTNLRRTMRTTSTRMTMITMPGGTVDRPRGAGQQR